MAQNEDVRNGRKADWKSYGGSSIAEAAQRFWKKSYAGDYIGLALLFAGFMLVKMLGTPFTQSFTLDDTRIQHPYAVTQRVENFWLFFYAVGIPLTCILLWALLYRRDIHKTHVTILGLAITVFMTLFLTDVLKDAIGRPRPDLISRCQPAPSTPRDELVDVDVCTQRDQHRLNDGWRSFPSGHSSLAFTGLGWLAMFVASQTHVLRPRASLIEVILTLAPLLGAAFIAISRLEDYRHGPLDVLGGSILGFTVAHFNWRRYYPSLWSKHCDEPHGPPDGRGSSPNSGFRRVGDEEEAFAGLEEFSIEDDVEDTRGHNR